MNKTGTFLGSFLAIAAVAAWIFYLKPAYEFHQVTGSWFPIHHVETLNSPRAVSRWTPDGLLLANGKLLPVPGTHNLPLKSKALAEVTKRGVEIDAQGRLWGLVKIQRECGNDPVVENIRRINLADFCRFERVGEPIDSIKFPDFVYSRHGSDAYEFGWDVRSLRDFNTFVTLEASYLAAQRK